jgi:hypothetical protein
MGVIIIIIIIITSSYIIRLYPSKLSAPIPEIYTYRLAVITFDCLPFDKVVLTFM